MIDYSIEVSPKNGEYTLALIEGSHKQYVMSKYQPKQSTLADFKQNLGNRSTIWILFGFQFGYLIDYLQEVIGQDVNILIIEPNEDLLEEALLLCGDQYMQNPHVHFFSGENWSNLKNQLDTLLGMENFNNYKLIPNKAYLTFYKEYYKKVLNIVKQRVEDKMINLHTIILGNSQNILNTVQNRYDMAHTCDMHEIAYKFQGIPAALVLAGPSLEKNIELLKDFNGLIFVVGRTLTPVCNLGVQPDLVFSVDNHDIIIETFGDYKIYDVPLVTLGQCNPLVVKGCQSPYKYFIYNGAEVAGLLNIRVNPCLDLAGSVATLCLSTANYLGCSPIIFLGQDLAFEGNKRYAKGADSFLTAGMSKEGTWGLRKIKGYYGNEVYSDAQMISFLNWIENFILTHPDSKYINCTEGGAYIHGAEHIPFKEAIDQYNPPEKVLIPHKFLSDNEGIDVDQSLVTSASSLKKIKEYVHEGAQHYDALIKLYTEEKSSKKRDKHVIKHVKQIEHLDKQIEEVDKANFLIDMLMERVKITLVASNDSKEPIGEKKEELRLRTLRLNRDTYTYLERECECLIILLKEEIEKAEEIIKNHLSVSNSKKIEE